MCQAIPRRHCGEQAALLKRHYRGTPALLAVYVHVCLSNFRTFANFSLRIIQALFGKTPSTRAHEARPDALVERSRRDSYTLERGAGAQSFFSPAGVDKTISLDSAREALLFTYVPVRTHSSRGFGMRPFRHHSSGTIEGGLPALLAVYIICWMHNPDCYGGVRILYRTHDVTEKQHTLPVFCLPHLVLITLCAVRYTWYNTKDHTR